MDCLETQLIVIEYQQSGTLKPEDRDKAARHLRGCENCRDILRDDDVPFSHLVPEEERVQALASDS